jgi:hypothetical protein
MASYIFPALMYLGFNSSMAYGILSYKLEALTIGIEMRRRKKESAWKIMTRHATECPNLHARAIVSVMMTLYILHFVIPVILLLFFIFTVIYYQHYGVRF